MKTNTNETISATDFKAKCLGLLDRLPKDGLVITKRGHPVARVLPYSRISNASLIGSMKGKIVIKGDIFSTGVSWDADGQS